MAKTEKMVEGARLTIVVGGANGNIVIEKHQHPEVHEVMKKYFQPEDYYFTATDSPLGVSSGFKWVQEVMKVARIS